MNDWLKHASVPFITMPIWLRSQRKPWLSVMLWNGEKLGGDESLGGADLGGGGGAARRRAGAVGCDPRAGTGSAWSTAQAHHDGGRGAIGSVVSLFFLSGLAY